MRWLKYVLGGIATGYGLTYYATQIEPTWLQVKRVKIPMPGLPTAFDNFRIVQLGDFHYSQNNLPPHYLQEIVDRTMNVSPDLIVLTGDFLHSHDDVHTDAPFLGMFLNQLEAPFGKLAVLGNHDYAFYHHGFHATPEDSTAMIIESLEQANITVLRNELHKLQKGGKQLQIVGFDDLDAGYFDVKSAMNGVNPNMPLIGLCHNPDAVTFFWRQYRMDLLMCGHTHGGQVKLPLLSIPRVVRHQWRTRGLHMEEGIYIYVNRGLGWGRFPVRFNARPEITVYVLKSI